MSGRPAGGETSVSPGRDYGLPSRVRRIDAACDGFERQWRSGPRPAIEDYLAEAPEAERLALLRELLALELDLRRGDGEAPGRGEYLERFPEQALSIDWAFGSGTSRPAAAAGPPSAVGRFRILRRHARGGLGEVFVARDAELNREVALKQILDRHADDPVSRNRFLLEAEITGSLEHPGIVPVHAMGLDERGQPYYAMRLIRGDNLQETIRAFHAEGASRSPGEQALALQKLLRRFLDVCNAVGYAHSRGVLHRDIKPSNIVVGHHGETLVVDWGLAKAFGSASVAPGLAAEQLTPLPLSGGAETLPGSALGTPAYMSPEQARGAAGAVGPRSDVYSLGATLYCLLTGKPPFEGDDIGVVLRQVQAGEFPPPRAIASPVDGALEAVCLRAMATRPDERYSTPQELAQDIERWLADEPVSAHSEPWTVRLGRWGRRHKPLVFALAALLIAAVVALAISTTLIERAQKQTEAQQRRAEDHFQLAFHAVDRMLREVGETELADMPQMEPVRRELLKEACQFYQQLLRKEGDDPALSLATGRAHSRLGDILELQGEYDPAEQSYRRAMVVFGGPMGEGSEVDRRREQARAMNGLGVLLKKLRRSGESERWLRAALELRRRLAAVRNDPADLQAEKDTLYQLGTLIARQAGRRSEAEAAYQEALQVQGDLVARVAANPEARKSRARYLNQWGILLEKSRPSDAEKAFREALSIQEELAEESPSVAGIRWALARTSSNLGSVLSAKRDDRAAREEGHRRYDQAVNLLKWLADDFPSVPDYRHDFASASANFGMLQLNQREFARAEMTLRSAVAVLETLVGQFPKRPDYQLQRAATYRMLGILLSRTQRPDDAGEVFRKARSVLEPLIAAFPEAPEYHSALGCAGDDLALLAMARGQLDVARHELSQALDHHRNAWLADESDRFRRECLLRDYTNLATVHRRLKEPAAAAEAAQQLPRLAPDDPDQYCLAAWNLALCAALASQDPNRAEEEREAQKQRYARRAVELLRGAVERGFQNSDELKSTDYDLLRARDDFQELVRRLEELARVARRGTTRKG
jgi:serine/threonine-protein kinase